jgi:hypothetical protein
MRTARVLRIRIKSETIRCGSSAPDFARLVASVQSGSAVYVIGMVVAVSLRFQDEPVDYIRVCSECAVLIGDHGDGGGDGTSFCRTALREGGIHSSRTAKNHVDTEPLGHC